MKTANSWTPEQEAIISKVMETTGANRQAAIKRLRRWEMKNLDRANKGLGPVGFVVGPAVEQETQVEQEPTASEAHSGKEKPVKTKKEKKAKKPRGEKKSSKQIYAERKAAGECVDCGHRKAKTNRCQCQICIDATAERAAKRAKK